MVTAKDKILAAQGKKKADLVLKNAQVLNVFTETLEKKDVAICDDTIVGIGTYDGEKEIDYTGKVICPGFIDSHIHIESSLVAPLTLSKVMLPHGTTTLIADPHELVNVAGVQAMDYFLRATENIPLDVFMMLPSSVPATAFETNGSDFTADDMKQFVGRSRVLGLGEVMCVPDVLNVNDNIMDKFSLLNGYAIDGHAPGLSGKGLQAYACAGVLTEHECTTFEEACEKVKAGFYILIREGSAAQNLEAIVKGLVNSNLPLDRCLFCTDDRHIDDIERDGHIDYAVRKAIKLGINPIKAIKMASYYAAQAYHLRGLGAVAANYKANLVVLDSLEECRVHDVYHAGKLITKEYCDTFSAVKPPEHMLHSVNVSKIDREKMSVKRHEKNHVIEVVPGQILTRHLLETVGGDAEFVPDKTYNKLCVIERHRKTGNIAAAPLKGFNIEGGAIAASVGHDSHNIIVVGDNDDDMIAAVESICNMQGGYSVIKNGNQIASLALPIGGLMSDDEPDAVVEKNKRLIEASHEIGVPSNVDPLFTLSFLSLPVIPQLRLTDKGLFDVDTFKMIE